VRNALAALGEDVRGKRQALVLDLAAQQTSIAGIAKASGLTRRGVRYIIAAHETGSNPDDASVPTQSLEQQNDSALAALEEMGARCRNVANDREGGARARTSRFSLNHAVDNGPVAPRVIPATARDMTEDEEIVALYFNDGLPEDYIANLIGEPPARVHRAIVAFRRAQKAEQEKQAEQAPPLAAAA
jgi:hypothetical protein